MPDFNVRFFEKLYSKLVASTLENPQQDLLILNNPGQLLPENPGQTSERDYLLSRLFDTVPGFSWIFRQQAGKAISKVYKSVLDHKETPLLAPLSPMEKHKLEDAGNAYERLIDAYLNYQYAYQEVLQSYLCAEASYKNGGAPIPTSLKMKLRHAEDKWIANGKIHLETCLAIIAEYSPRDIPHFWNTAINRFQSCETKNAAGSTFQGTGFMPVYHQWFSNAGWSGFSFNKKDLDNQAQALAVGVAEGLPPSFGLFTISEKNDFIRDRQFLKITDVGDISCELKRINIKRGWLDQNVLTSRAWRFDRRFPEAQTILSSGGDLAQNIAATGEMTVLPEAAILCKNVTIQGNFTGQADEQIRNAIRANHAVGFGPFTLSGKYLGQEQSEQCKASETHINMPGVQLIGLVCKVLPRSPNPDPRFPWKG